MENLLKFAILILIPFLIGKIIASMDKPFIKNILKFKRYENITDRMINNYYGNLISMLGIDIFCAIIFGLDSMIFFAILSVSILTAYIFHIANATGVSLEEAIQFVLRGDYFREKKLFFQTTTLCAIMSILVTGIIATIFLSPVLLKDINHINASYNKESTTTEVFEVPNNNESEFYEELEKYFN